MIYLLICKYFMELNEESEVFDQIRTIQTALNCANVNAEPISSRYFFFLGIFAHHKKYGTGVCWAFMR